MEEDEAFGNQMGDAYVNSDLMRALKESRRVSFCWPQFVPARARRMLSREAERCMMVVMCGVKVKWVSKVTPRKQGLRSRGSELL